MLRIPDSRLEMLLNEDVPYIDLTSTVLGINQEPGEIEYYSREDCVLCCTEEVVRMMSSLDVTVTLSKPSGSHIAADETFLKAYGSAGSLHMAWKVCLNMFDHYSAIATKTDKMVRAVKAENPRCEVLTTRKSAPGCKDLTIKAIITGGALPHRLGLSETVLVFDQHLEFIGGIDGLIAQLNDIKSRVIEKKLFVEADANNARRLAQAGVDGIQLDKVPASELTLLVNELRGIDPHVTLIAAGGIGLENAAEYAATGVDGIATTALFTAKPLDMSVRMSRR